MQEIGQSRVMVCRTPLPVWENDVTGKYICIGSVEQLKQYSGLEDITDLHKDIVDNITFTIAGE